MIDARALHKKLGVRQRFNDWIGERIAAYGFEGSTDFYCFSSKTRGRPRLDYLLTIDMAKELSMVERTPMGRAIRRYFIEMEKAAHEMARTLVDEGKPDAIPQSYFDAQQALAMEQRLLAAIEAKASPASKQAPAPEWPEFVTARAVADHGQRRVHGMMAPTAT